MSILDPRAMMAIILALVLCAGGGYLKGKSVGKKQAEAASVKAQLVAVEQVRVEEKRRTDEQAKIAEDARKQAEDNAASAAAANDAAGKLRKRVADLVAASKHPAPAGISAPANSAPDLLAGLLNKSVERNQQLAAYADSARTAGQACIGHYQALTEKTP